MSVNDTNEVHIEIEPECAVISCDTLVEDAPPEPLATFVDGTNKVHISEAEASEWINSRLNTLTTDYLQSRIASVQYLVHPNGRTTLCTITLDNLAIVTGESHCLDPANFNKALGEKYSFDTAFDKLWELLGFSRLELAYQAKTVK